MKRDTTTYDLSHFSKILKPVTQKALGKHATAHIDLISNWISIVGNDVGSYSMPQTIKHKNKQNNDATLVVGVISSAFSLEISSRKNILIQKINAFFGYSLIADIQTIVCDVIVKKMYEEEKEVVSSEDASYIESRTKDVKSSDLRSALENLGASILRRNKQ